MKQIATVGRRGRRRQLSEAQLEELAKLLKAGAIAAGYANELWTLPRIGALIESRFGVRLTIPSVWRNLRHMGWSVQQPVGQARQRDEQAIAAWKKKRWPALKIAARQRQIIVFIDESNLSERPCRARTWAPRGETPVLQYSFSWKQLSAIAGVSFVRFYFRLFAGAIRSPQVVEFLKALSETIGQKLR